MKNIVGLAAFLDAPAAAGVTASSPTSFVIETVMTIQLARLKAAAEAPALPIEPERR